MEVMQGGSVPISAFEINKYQWLVHHKRQAYLIEAQMSIEAIASNNEEGQKGAHNLGT